MRTGANVYAYPVGHEHRARSFVNAVAAMDYVLGRWLCRDAVIALRCVRKDDPVIEGTLVTNPALFGVVVDYDQWFEVRVRRKRRPERRRLPAVRRVSVFQVVRMLRTNRYFRRPLRVRCLTGPPFNPGMYADYELGFREARRESSD